MTLLTNVKYCGYTYCKNIQFFHTFIVQQRLDITITSFINAGLVGDHKPRPVNMEFHTAVTQLYDAHISVLVDVCWYTALLEDVSITVMAQVDEASLPSAFSSTSW